MNQTLQQFTILVRSLRITTTQVYQREWHPVIFSYGVRRRDQLFQGVDPNREALIVHRHQDGKGHEELELTSFVKMRGS